ncbi:LysR family transcriptional regulator [Treponema sp.]|uniref:LysR family transcriptional regulator n=1 Tax=Treponema sp. TaxID=166 RepID=UPI00257AE3A2|nr:LysR family transcriptional regulator [Treponema sp.]MBE6355136.1 LysR family transcriptional regulator [Treponema sp.]
MELIQLHQLTTIADEKVLSHAAEKLNISQPALSRSIQHLEDEFELKLFDRKKNSMTLNEAGLLVVEQAKLILKDVESLKNKIEAYKNQSSHISLISCAPAPLWKMTAELSSTFPSIAVTTSMPDEDEIISLILSEKADIAIVHTEIDSEAIQTSELLSEQLYVQIPLSDSLSKKNSIKFSDLSGKEIREYTKIGFWHKLHRGCIHDASYIEYDDMMVYANIVKSQNYLTFVTELGNTLVRKQDKSVTIPITDKEATARYRLAYLKKNFNRLQKIIEWAETAAKSW